MIRTKKSNNIKVEVLPPQAPTEHLTPGERGGGNGAGKSDLPWYMRSRYYKNPPEEHKFKPGCEPGPGRPPYKVLTNALWEQLNKVDPKTEEPRYMALIESIIDKAIGKSPGSGTHAQLIFERIDGLLKQKLELSGAIAHIHTSMSELIQLSNLTDQELLLVEKVGLRALAVAEQEAREREGEGNV